MNPQSSEYRKDNEKYQKFNWNTGNYLISHKTSAEYNNLILLDANISLGLIFSHINLLNPYSPNRDLSTDGLLDYV